MVTYMYDQLKADVCSANKELHALGLAPFTWGNVSAVDRERGVFAIKPSGVPYDDLTPENMVVISLEDGSVVKGIIIHLPIHPHTTSFTKNSVI